MSRSVVTLRRYLFRREFGSSDDSRCNKPNTLIQRYYSRIHFSGNQPGTSWHAQNRVIWWRPNWNDTRTPASTTPLAHPSLDRILVCVQAVWPQDFLEYFTINGSDHIEPSYYGILGVAPVSSDIFFWQKTRVTTGLHPFRSEGPRLKSSLSHQNNKIPEKDSTWRRQDLAYYFGLVTSSICQQLCWVVSQLPWLSSPVNQKYNCWPTCTTPIATRLHARCTFHTVTARDMS